MKRIKFSAWAIFIWICLFNFFFHGTLSAQPPDRIVAHLDKGVYFTGENLWYKLYFLQEKVESRIVHVALLDDSGKTAVQQKLLIDNKQAYGDLIIPNELKPGHYSFCAYTRWNLNYPSEVLCLIPIIIYTESNNKPLVPVFFRPPDPALPSKPVNLKIETSLDTFKPRDIVSVMIRMADDRGNPLSGDLSIAVVDSATPAPPVNITGANEILSQYTFPANPKTIHFLPQKNLTINGRVFSQERKPLESNYLSLWIVEDAANYWVQTSDGGFHLTLTDFYGEKTLQIHDFAPSHDKIPLVTLTATAEQLSIPRLTRKDKLIAEDTLRSLENHLKLMEDHLRRSRIETIFDLNAPKSKPSLAPLTSPFQPDKSYETDKFINFSKLGDFIVEGMPWVYVLSENGKRTIRIDNYDTNIFFEAPPLVLVDHYLTLNENAVINLDWKLIASIDQFMKLQTLQDNFGLLGMNGVLSIYTKERNTPEIFTDLPNIFTIRGLHQSRDFPIPVFYENKHTKNRIPDFRSVVYWNPKVETDQQGIAVVRFLQTDAIGTYRITVSGITNEGQPVSEEAYYRVWRE